MFANFESKSVEDYKQLSEYFWYAAKSTEWKRYENMIQPFLQIGVEEKRSQRIDYVQKVVKELQQYAVDETEMSEKDSKERISQLLFEGQMNFQDQVCQKGSDEIDETNYVDFDESYAKEDYYRRDEDSTDLNEEEIEPRMKVEQTRMDTVQVVAQYTQMEIVQTEQEQQLNCIELKARNHKLVYGVRGITYDHEKNSRCYQLAEFDVIVETQVAFVKGRITEWFYFREPYLTPLADEKLRHALEDCRFKYGSSEWIQISDEEMVMITRGKDLTPYYKYCQEIEILHLKSEDETSSETDDSFEPIFEQTQLGRPACQFIRDQVLVMKASGMLASGKNDIERRSSVRLDYESWDRKPGAERYLNRYSLIVNRGFSPWENGEDSLDVEDGSQNPNASAYWRMYLSGIRGQFAFSRLKRVTLLVMLLILLLQAGALTVDVSKMSESCLKGYSQILCENYVINFDPREMTQSQYDKMPILYRPYIDAKLECLVVQEYLKDRERMR
jgi:hypothetical protein